MPEPYDVIHLTSREPGEDADIVGRVAAVVINGLDLRWLSADAVRRRLGEDPIDPDDEPADEQYLFVEDVAPPSQHWLGRPTDPEITRGDHAGVLNCGCGAFGCGGLAARITVGDDVVTWSDFIDPWGNPEDVGPFRFERKQYEAELRGLQRNG